MTFQAIRDKDSKSMQMMIVDDERNITLRVLTPGGADNIYRFSLVWPDGEGIVEAVPKYFPRDVFGKKVE